MKHTYVALLVGIVLGLSTAVEAEVARESVGPCFDTRMISIHQLQHLDMCGAFETVYEMAELSDSLDELPVGFMRCLEVLRSGNDRVRCCDFIVSMRLIIDKILLMRGSKSTQRGLCLNSLSLEDEFNEFADAVSDSLFEIWNRLAVLEVCCGLR